MQIEFTNNGRRYSADLLQGTSLAFDVDFESPQLPDYFGPPKAMKRPLKIGRGVAETRQGAAYNAYRLLVVPHCNSTHTETVAHIVSDEVPVGDKIQQALLPAVLISVDPVPASQTDERYQPRPGRNDWVITSESIVEQLAKSFEFVADALIVRAQPLSSTPHENPEAVPEIVPYFTNEAMQEIVRTGFRHLLVDLPSVDRLDDDGVLSNHRIFWNVPLGSKRLDSGVRLENTITELLRIPYHLIDGPCLVSIQIPSFRNNAASSRPIVYPVREISE